MNELIGKVVTFTKNIEDMEAYPEAGMKARIARIDVDTSSTDLHDHMYTITFDYSEFDQFNTQFESANYYNRDHVACLTAREANMYQVREKIYFGSPKLFPFDDFFKVVDTRQAILIERFKASGESNYVAWLESQIAV